MATSGSAAPDAGPPEHGVIIEDALWKLSVGGNPSDSSCWTLRRLWITDGGGLFYNDRRGEPRGSHCRNLDVRAVVLEGCETNNRFAFEVRPKSSQSNHRFVMVLAAATADDRSVWLRHISSFEGATGDRNSLSPYDIYAPTRLNQRRRSSATLDMVGPDGTCPEEAVMSKVLSLRSSEGPEVEGTPRSSRSPRIKTQSCGSGSGLSTPLTSRSMSPRNSDKDADSQEPSAEVPVIITQSVDGPAASTPSRSNFVPRTLSGERLSAQGQDDGDGRNSTGSADEAFFGSEGKEESDVEGNSVPKSMLPQFGGGVRRNSQSAFAEKAHTTLVLDWDDTIFPTTWIRSDCGMNWKLQLHMQLDPGPRMNLIQGLLAKLLEQAVAFLQEAALYANIFIVTLARRPWVEMSMQNFLPELARVIEILNLKVIYAQEYESGVNNEYEREEFLSSEEVCAFWTCVKSRAISQELDAFHKRHNLSWKNVISVGDSDFERFGTINAGEDYMRREMEGGALKFDGPTAEGVSKDGHLKRLRTKTVKLLGEPTVEELTAELTLLKRWLPHVVARDSGFDVEIDSTDDDVRLNEMDHMITGEDAQLSWHELAGMSR